MIVENLNNNVMLVELSVDEMKKYDITYENLNNQDRKNQVAIKNLLKQIDQQNLHGNSGKVIVEAMPIDGGGCFFIFTFPQPQKRYKLKKTDSVCFYHLEKLDDLLDFLNVTKKTPNSDIFINAYKMNKNYYVSVSNENSKIKTILNEFGNETDKTTGFRILEYGKNIGKFYLQ
ncbi:MAG: hypothetical protein IKV25_02255 [Clostridia bacterium]|nr:hypothetical protein [Clostridia bacterium]